MQLSPVPSPPPVASPDTAPPLLVDVQAPVAAPVASPPFPPSSSGEPPVLSPPRAAPLPLPEIPSVSPPLPAAASPPIVIPATPVDPPPPHLPPVAFSPPPADIVVSPETSPPPPLLDNSPPPPNIPFKPPSLSPPPQASTLPPVTSLPPLSTPAPPQDAVPPPLVSLAPSLSLPLPKPGPINSPLASLASPPPPLPFFNEDPQSPPFQESSPPAPSSPLPLAVAKGGLPTTKESKVSATLIFGCVSGLILLLIVLALVFIAYKNRKSKRIQKSGKCNEKSYPATQDGFADVATQISSSQSHVIIMPPKSLPLPLPASYRDNSEPNTTGRVNPSPLQATSGLSCGSGTFTYDELVAATNGFSESNLLGQGGFGYVYRGVLPNGKQVAVKQLKAGSDQGEREFQAEVDTISRVHHKHLVSLVGYCITGAERLLVYEFVPNGTLEFHLHGEGQPVLDWETRMKIAIGSAKGIAYLHEDCNPTIIHRDIKAANILLDSKFEAKVSDFGLAKLFSNANAPVTHICTRVVGTFGYLAPEYALTGKLTDKSDVYSYGVMLLELITGRPPISIRSLMNESLVEWARPLLAQAMQDGNFDALADPKLQNSYHPSKMASMVSCAAACLRHSAWLRPRMTQVVHALEEDISLAYLSEGLIRTGSSTMYSPFKSSVDEGRREGEPENFNRMLASKKYGISGYSGTTSEYGLNVSCSSSDSEQTK